MVAFEEENGWIKGKPFSKTQRICEKDKINALRNTSKFEISLSVREIKENKKSHLQGELVFNTDLFTHETAQRLLKRFLRFTQEAIKNPDHKFTKLTLIPEQELNLIKKWGTGISQEIRHSSVLDLIEAQSQKNPDKVAIRHEEREIAYGELWNETERIASFLEKNSIYPGERVALLMERSPDLLIALISIMKSGATYVPIDPEFPIERIKFILDDANIKMMITDVNTCNILPINSSFAIEKIRTLSKGYPEIRKSCFSSRDAAYLLYTSGSSGKPKGVLITHMNLLNDISYMINFQIPKDHFRTSLFSTSLCFDQAVEEIFPALSTGGTVYVVENVLDLSWRDKSISFMATTPSVMQSILSDPIPTTLKSIVLGGESLQKELVRDLYERSPRINLYNSYGPTECTDQSLVKLVSPNDDRITIGKPIANTDIYILDCNRKPVPAGVLGEIYIGGMGVGKGYINRDDLNTIAFTKIPQVPNRVYKTGDIGKWNFNGEVEFLGREDTQVKINGVRIELSEIREVLLLNGKINNVVVQIAKDDTGESKIVCYIEVSNLTEKEAREHCKKYLSYHMIPETYCFIDKWPLTPNGKIDIQKLPKIDISYSEESVEHTSETFNDPLTAKLVDIFQDVLEKSNVSPEQSFFSLGGHSLLALKVLAIIKKEWDVRLKMRDFLLNPQAYNLSIIIKKDRKKSCERVSLIPDLSQIPEGGKSIVIVGAGVAGIMAAIECQKRNIDFIIVEKNADIGGIWLDGCNSDSKLQTTSHVYTVDPTVKHSCQYPNKAQMLDYLEGIFNKHQLKQHILFDTTVHDVVSHGSDEFSVITKSRLGQESETISCDGILVCTGKHRIPKIPNWKREKGSLQVVHASRLDQVNLKGKKVLVIGAGSYAIEAIRIAYSHSAESIEVLAKKYYWVLPTFVDTLINTNIDNSALTFNDYYNKISEVLMSSLEQHYKNYNIAHLIPKGDARAFNAYISTSDEFYKIIESKLPNFDIGEIVKLTKGGVYTNTNRYIRADIVIAATGYEDTNLSFLNKIGQGNPEVYKGFMLKNDPRVGFVGFLDMVISATAVIPQNLKLCLSVMQNRSYRPPRKRVEQWLDSTPQDIIQNVKSHVSWLQEEEEFLSRKKPEEKKDLLSDFDEIVSKYGKNTALIERGQKISFSELSKMANIIAKILLRKNISRIAIRLPNSIEYVALLLGAFKIGCDVINIGEKEDEAFLRAANNNAIDLVVATTDIKSTLLNGLALKMAFLSLDIQTDFDFSQFCKGLENLTTSTHKDAKIVDNKTCLFFTSGTTALPKEVRHSYKSLSAAIVNFDRILTGKTKNAHRLILVNALHHVGGFMSAFSILLRGGTLILEKGFEPNRYKKLLSQYSPSIIILMSSWLSEILSRSSEINQLLKSVKKVVVGGERIHHKLVKKFGDLKEINLTSTFGLSECGPLFCQQYMQEGLKLGESLPGVSYKIMNNGTECKLKGDIGELFVKVDSLFHSSKNINGEWFRTGDYVKLGTNKSLIYKGREGDLITDTIFTQDVEDYLLTFPEIEEVVVSQNYAQNKNVISIQVKADRSLKESKILQSLRDSYQFNFELEVVKAFKRGATGKICKNKAKQKIIFPIDDIKPFKALFFPGQGVQYPGMIDKTVEFSMEEKQLIDRIQTISGKNVSKICKFDSQVSLDRTDICQISIFTVCALELLRTQNSNNFIFNLQNCKYAMGLSLGEYIALYATQSISLEEVVRLLVIRGNAMQRASELTPQAMVSVSNINGNLLDKLMRKASKCGKLYVANYLTQDQFVIAGDQAACSSLIQLCQSSPSLTAIRLNVAGAFHTPFMTPALEELKLAIMKTNIEEPLVPIISNYDGKPTITSEEIRSKLIMQLDHPVRFSDGLYRLFAENIKLNEVLEIGPKKSITGFWNRFVRNENLKKESKEVA